MNLRKNTISKKRLERIKKKNPIRKEARKTLAKVSNHSNWEQWQICNN